MLSRCLEFQSLVRIPARFTRLIQEAVMANKVQGLPKFGEYWHYSLKANGQRIHGWTREIDRVTTKDVLNIRNRVGGTSNCIDANGTYTPAATVGSGICALTRHVGSNTKTQNASSAGSWTSPP
jgi:hypothetical protein